MHHIISATVFIPLCTELTVKENTTEKFKAHNDWFNCTLLKCNGYWSDKHNVNTV